ncbi:MAG: DUF1579 family protein [Acidobacteriota bacterium]|nr:MAG: DUF1579 family protein [Acidobacteriota bacterium]
MVKDCSIGKIVLTIVLLTVVGVATLSALSAQPGPEHEKMHVWLGDWTWEEEIRDSPDDKWYQASWKGQNRLMPGGFFIEFRWKGIVKGAEISMVEIEGYDPAKKTNVTSFFDSQGNMGGVTSASYQGNTEEVEYSSMSPTGEKIQARCTWRFSADANSASGSCERLSDGKWWLFRRVVKAEKVK